MLDYKNLEKVVVTNQKEMDAIPLDYKGFIIIRSTCTIVVTKGYHYRVEVMGNSSVVAWENSSVEAWEHSSVTAKGNCSVEARGNSFVVAWDSSSVVAWGNSSVEARENSSIEAWDSSSVEAWENSSVVAGGSSSVVAWGSSSIIARENSSVVAYANSSVEASGNSQIVNGLTIGNVKINGNAREIFMPKTIHEFMEFYDINHTDTRAIFYKAVRKMVKYTIRITIMSLYMLLVNIKQKIVTWI